MAEEATLHYHVELVLVECSGPKGSRVLKSEEVLFPDRANRETAEMAFDAVRRGGGGSRIGGGPSTEQVLSDVIASMLTNQGLLEYEMSTDEADQLSAGVKVEVSNGRIRAKVEVRART